MKIKPSYSQTTNHCQGPKNTSKRSTLSAQILLLIPQLHDFSVYSKKSAILVTSISGRSTIETPGGKDHMFTTCEQSQAHLDWKELQGKDDTIYELASQSFTHAALSIIPDLWQNNLLAQAAEHCWFLQSLDHSPSAIRQSSKSLQPITKILSFNYGSSVTDITSLPERDRESHFILLDSILHTNNLGIDLLCSRFRHGARQSSI